MAGLPLKYEGYTPRATAYSVFHLVSRSFALFFRQASHLVPSNFSSDYHALPQSPLPLFHTERSMSRRRKLILLVAFAISCMVFIFGFFQRVADHVPFLQSGHWDKTDVATFLGSGYHYGRVVSPSEWSTFTFGSKPIPAPPPAEPGSTIMEVQPPSDWLNCEAAKELAKSLPEVVFITLEDSLKYDNDDMDFAWLDEWLANGSLKGTRSKPATPVLDVVYTWVNGSDVVFQESKDAVETKSRLAKIPGYINDSLNRHKDWDELKYSIRSIEKFFERDSSGKPRFPSPVGNLTIVSTDYGYLQGSPQTPLWLNTSHPKAPEIVSQESLVTPILEDTCALQTFSSCSVEARLDRLQSANDKFLSLSDDMLLSNQHSAADIYSPLYGLPFTFEYDWSHFIIDFPPAFGPLEHRFGEFPYLYFSAYLLYVRFGWEWRSYNKHTVHSMSRSILRELRSTFPSAFETSSAQRFRGESPSIHLWFLFYWYVIERHRESLIWSYLYGKLQNDTTGSLDLQDLEARLRRIDTSKPFTRDTLLPNSTATAYKDASIEPNIASMALWSSADGPVWLSAEEERDLAKRFDQKFLIDKEEFEEPRQLGPCEMRPECFEFAEATDGNVAVDLVFEKWRKVDRSCGDCMINALLRESGPKGFSALLPDDPKKRKIALKSIHRFSYTVSRVDARYGMMDSAEIVGKLAKEWIEQKPSEVCFNDHFHSEDPSDIANFAKEAKGFFETYYPQKSKWEL